VRVVNVDVRSGRPVWSFACVLKYAKLTLLNSILRCTFQSVKN
jgi:hypothetical protein